MNPKDKAVVREEMASRLQSDSFLTEAIQQAVREAVWDHKRAGNPIAGWKEGRVVIVPPEEIFADEDFTTIEERH